MYEILTFTGNKKTASCDSKVEVRILKTILSLKTIHKFIIFQFVLTGEYDETGSRVLDPGTKMKVDGFDGTLRKGCVDSYILKTPRLY